MEHTSILGQAPVTPVISKCCDPLYLSSTGLQLKIDAVNKGSKKLGQYEQIQLLNGKPAYKLKDYNDKEFYLQWSNLYKLWMVFLLLRIPTFLI